MLGIALLRVYPWWLVALWYLGVAVVQFGRGSLIRWHRFRRLEVSDPAKSGHSYLLDVVVAGLYWGGSLAALAIPQDLLTQQLMAMAIGGLAVGSITVHAYHRPVMYAFLGCVLLPFIARVLWIGDFAHTFLGLGLLLLGLYLAVFGRFHAATLERSITLRHENRQLIAQLQVERAAAVQLQAVAEAANQAKSRFFAGASHDLRQPLQALSLYAAVLSESDLPSDLHRASVRVGQSVRVLEDLFEGVLDIAHVEAGGMQLKQEPVEVTQLMERAMLLFGGEALDKGLSLKHVPSSRWVLGDPLALQRIVSNLVANAVRHTQHGRVLLGARKRGPKLRLMVLDTGPGIDAAFKARIFEEFYRLPSSSGHGFGLGLATVKRLCDAAGYGLDFDSVAGRGSRFWIDVPWVAPPPLAIALGQTSGGAASASCLNVLLVEDDPAARDSLQTILRSWGHLCEAVPSGREALVMTAQQTTAWDLLVSDFDLPDGQNGLEVAKAVRTLVPHKLPTLLISGTMNQALREAAAAADCIALAKPVRPLQLRSVVDLVAAQRAT